MEDLIALNKEVDKRSPEERVSFSLLLLLPLCWPSYQFTKKKIIDHCNILSLSCTTQVGSKLLTADPNNSYILIIDILWKIKIMVSMQAHMGVVILRWCVWATQISKTTNSEIQVLDYFKLLRLLCMKFNNFIFVSYFLFNFPS